MCQWGTETIVHVRVQSDLSCTGEARWKDVGIDACIAPLVQALQAAGIDMRASCCGHEKAPGRIDLADGRLLWITSGASQAQEKEPPRTVVTLTADQFRQLWADVSRPPSQADFDTLLSSAEALAEENEALRAGAASQAQEKDEAALMRGDLLVIGRGFVYFNGDDLRRVRTRDV